MVQVNVISAEELVFANVAKAVEIYNIVTV
jgi:hypothetical protein